MHNPILWITVANALYLASYSVRDILWLRILSVAGALLLIPYYAFQPIPLMDAIAWSAVFITINTVWIVLLIVEQRPVHLAQDDARLRVLSFPSLTAREARNLFAKGIWEDIGVGASIVEHDNRSQRFSVILRGNADVMYHGTRIAQLGSGQFVGTIDQRARTAPIDVIVRDPVRIKCWGREQLGAFVATRPDVELALERSVGLEVQRMLTETLSHLDTSKT